MRSPAANTSVGTAATAAHPLAERAQWLGVVGVVSLMLVALSWVALVGTLAAPVAWMWGRRAMREIAAQPDAYRDEGGARIGRALGFLGTLLTLTVVLASLAVAFVDAAAEGFRPSFM